MDPLVLLQQKWALSREKKPCLVQKWLMHERNVNEIKEIRNRSEKEREQIFRRKVKGMIGQKVGSRSRSGRKRRWYL